MGEIQLKIESEKSGSDLEYLYRYDTANYSTGITVSLHRYRIVKRTPKGFWISDYSFSFPQKDRWVSATGKKRYAYPTQDEALESFMYRKLRYMRILEGRLRNAKISFEAGAALLSQDEGDKFRKRLEAQYNDYRLRAVF